MLDQEPKLREIIYSPQEGIMMGIMPVSIIHISNN